MGGFFFHNIDQVRNVVADGALAIFIESNVETAPPPAQLCEAPEGD
jgi:hypothetical protein